MMVPGGIRDLFDGCRLGSTYSIGGIEAVQCQGDDYAVTPRPDRRGEGAAYCLPLVLRDAYWAGIRREPRGEARWTRADLAAGMGGPP